MIGKIKNMKKKRVKFDPVIVTVKPDIEKNLNDKKLIERIIKTKHWARKLGSDIEIWRRQVEKENLEKELVQIDCNVVECERLFTSSAKLNKFLKFLQNNYTNLDISFKSYKAY